MRSEKNPLIDADERGEVLLRRKPSCGLVAQDCSFVCPTLRAVCGSKPRTGRTEKRGKDISHVKMNDGDGE